MGWPTIADSVLLKDLTDDPSQRKVAKTTDILDGEDKLVRGPWWCRDLAPEYVTDYVWNPIDQNLHVDMSALTDMGWMMTFGPPPGCDRSGGFTPANSFPAGQPVLLTKYEPYVGHIYGWNYRRDVSFGAYTSRIDLVCGPIEHLEFVNFPPDCYGLGIQIQLGISPFGSGIMWFGIKSGNDPRGEYVMCCTNSARPLLYNFSSPNNGWRVWYNTGGNPATPQLCPCNIEYTPQIFSFTVTD